MISTIAGIVVTIVLFCLGVVFSGGSLLWFFDVPSLFIVLGFDAAALLVSGSLREFALGVTAVFLNRSTASHHQLRNAAKAFGLMYRCSIGGGIIGFVMGLVMMLVNPLDPKVIGPYLAVGILTILYGMLISYLFFLPGQYKLLKLASGADTD